MVTYVETMVLPAFSNFESFFQVTDASTIAWILSAYLLVGVVVTPIFGKLGDIYGKKRMLLVAMAVYTVAVSIAGFTPNIGAAFGLTRPNQIYVLIAVRALQGVGMAMFPLGFAMLPGGVPGRQGRTGPGHPFRDVRRRCGARTGGRRLDRPELRLAADVPHGHPGRAPRADPRGGVRPRVGDPGRAEDRFPRGGQPGDRPHFPHARHHGGRLLGLDQSLRRVDRRGRLGGPPVLHHRIGRLRRSSSGGSRAPRAPSSRSRRSGSGTSGSRT